MESYFKIKLVTEFLIPIMVFALIIVGIVVWTILATWRKRRIEKFFLSHGYERKLLGVASFGGVDFWGWIRTSKDSSDLWNDVVDDRDIKGMSLREIKKRYS